MRFIMHDSSVFVIIPIIQKSHFAQQYHRLELKADKTRLIEVGRSAAQNRSKRG